MYAIKICPSAEFLLRNAILSVFIDLHKNIQVFVWALVWKHNIEYISVAKLNLLGPYSYLSKSETTVLLIFNVLLPQSLRSIAIAIKHQGFHVNDKP